MKPDRIDVETNENGEIWTYTRDGTALRVRWTAPMLNARTVRRRAGAPTPAPFTPRDPDVVWASAQKHFGGWSDPIASLRSPPANPDDLARVAGLSPDHATELALALGGLELVFRTMRRWAEGRQWFETFQPLLSDAARACALSLDDAAAAAASRLAREIGRGAPPDALIAMADVVHHDTAFVHDAVVASYERVLAIVPPRVLALVDDLPLLTQVIARWPASARQTLGHYAFDLLESLGPDAAPLLVTSLLARESDAGEHVERVVTALAAIESTEATEGLVRLLGSKRYGGVAKTACERLGARAIPALEAMAAGRLRDRKGAGNAAIAVARKLLDAVAPAPASASEEEPLPPDAPSELVSPPWQRPARPQVHAFALELLPGPELVDAATDSPIVSSNVAAVARIRAAVERARDGTDFTSFGSLLHLPPNEALAAWQSVPLDRFRDDWEGALPLLVRRLGVPAIPLLLTLAEKRLREAVPALACVASARVALPLARARAHSRNIDVAAIVEHWLVAHPDLAAAGLVPAALSSERADRAAAVQALGHLAASGHRETMFHAAACYGEDARSALAAVLDDASSLRVGKGPAFARGEDLPRLVLRDGTPLPPRATDHLVTMLRFTPAFPAYRGIASVREACTAESLAAVANALFTKWLERGADPTEDWALFALGHLGGDAEVERLAAQLPGWQASSAHARAKRALEVMALVGTESAFTQLDRVARKSRYPLLRDAANAALERVARKLGLSVDDFDDRRAPTLGLDARGELTLDLGVGHLVVASLDERLLPVLRDAQGARLASLPKRGTDAEAYANAERRLKELRKQAKLASEAQLARFEHSMMRERTWSREAFVAYVVAHPLLAHIARRLVWGTSENASASDDDAPVFFRVAEDGSFADLEDRAVTLAPYVRIAHPARMHEFERARWVDRLREYEVIQPFAQLARSVHDIDDADRSGMSLTSLVGRTVPWDKAAALQRRGFRPASPDGVLHTLSSKLPFDVDVLVSFEPGLNRGDVRTSGPQTIAHADAFARAAGIARLADLGRVARSELMLALAPLLER